MTDNPFADAFETTENHNQPVFSVSQLSGALKRTVEDAFSLVRVRGEISGFKRATSGHLYLALKDEEALIDAICWKGVAAKLDLRPQDGMEVICKGRLTTYPGRSKYQLVIEHMELAGEGALLKLLEDLKRKLNAEGLFDPARKKKLPFLPTTIGIVTSPTGAVIRDIMHRLNDRFPRHVLLWPCLVQGKGAAEQITEAIRGFNAIKEGGPVPRPDLLIVARGGGSLEDLWCFNEEIVVRATAESDIPLISAVGHETDTTLIDYASDQRAPTPTAAAEMAVPVRRELLALVKEEETRLLRAIDRLLDERKNRTTSLARAIPNPQRLVDDMTQRLDDRIERFVNATHSFFTQRDHKLHTLALKIPKPQQHLSHAQDRLHHIGRSLRVHYQNHVQKQDHKYQRLSAMVREKTILDALSRKEENLKNLSSLLESYSYKGVLQRGFSIISNDQGKTITRASQLQEGETIQILFGDDSQSKARIIDQDHHEHEDVKPKAGKTTLKKKSAAKKPEQGSLF